MFSPHCKVPGIREYFHCFSPESYTHCMLGSGVPPALHFRSEPPSCDPGDGQRRSRVV